VARHWPSEAIWEAVYPLLPDFTVEVLPEVDSTNSELMRRVRAGQTAPVLLVAERQTAGRGRLGRQWLSDGDDAALTFSIALPMAPPEIRLKWPNDLWLTEPKGDRKLGGILIETAAVAEQRMVVVGVGLNIGPRPVEGLATPPAWLTRLWPEATAPAALGRLAAPLLQTLLRFERTGFAPFRTAFEARDALRGRHVSVFGGAADMVDGVACGVSPGGALLVQTDACIKEVTSAEVSVRPA
jgi:BirA family biotin operon repressor/biotin-[acetyl-CoA-carboxylase] ligase